MSNLTFFQKALIITGLLAVVVLLAVTCNRCLTNQNQAYQQPYQQPTVQYVTQPDGTSFMMNYLLYQQLMSQGGQGAVNNYYYSHRNEPEFQPQQQQSYQQTYQVETQKSKGFGTVTKPVETQKSNGFGNTSTSTAPPPTQVTTQKSNGFGNTQPNIVPPPTQVNTQKSNGFGNISPQKSITTEKSGGFGVRNPPAKVEAPKPAKTNSSKGFGKKN